MSTHFFPTGASYYPPHHDADDWARDVAAMADAGMTCIRSAELLASWDYIEKVRGQPDWGWLDALFAAAQRHGIRILLGTGSCNPPIWMRDRYPDVAILDRDDRPFPTGTVWGWACRNHPGLRAEVARYLTLLLARYADHPALWAWQIDNEPGFPFITRRGEEHPRIYDYNAHTAHAFRDWLRAKYGTLDALNVAWRWDCTHHQYAEWSQVQPPRSMPQEWGVVTAWLDWRTFLNENMAAFIRWQHDLIKTRDQQHPTMTNIFALAGREVEMGLDPWLMARQCDVIGYDLYPGIGRRLHTEPEFISMFLDYGRSTALHARVPFWLPELESGPVSGWALGPDYTTKAADITRYNLEALGHGAKAILYQGYREWPCIPIHWGALADFAGVPTPRYAAAQQINALVGAQAAFFNAAQPPRARVAIYDDTRNRTLLHGMGALDLLHRCQRGAYRAFWRAGVPVEFVSGAALTTADREPDPAQAHRYDIVVLSCTMLLDAATGAALRRFVERGGTLIACAKCAWVDGGGWSWAQQPGAALDELFGVQAEEIERDDQVVLTAKDAENAEAFFAPSFAPFGSAAIHVAGHWHKQALQPQPGVEVLARFADGSVAITRNRVGAGQAIYVGTHLDAAALDDDDAARLLRALAGDPAPPLLLHAEPATVDAHLLVEGARRLILLTNNGSQSASARIVLPADGAAQCDELLTGAALVVAHDAGSVSIALELPAWGGAAVLIG